MTAITHPGGVAARRSPLRDLVRRSASGVATLARRLRTTVADIAASGQLGPDPETEAGRWTGART
jgi:hypothetical protein